VLRLILAFALGVAGAGGMNAPLEPVLTGLATWYGAPYIGRVMRNGDVYTGTQMTVAVDDAMWPSLAGKWLLVVDAGTGRRVKVRVTDTGYLAGWNVCVDLSPTAMDVLTDGTRDTTRVECYVIEEE